MLDLANPHTLNGAAQLFFALLIGHAIADYPLQGDFLALHKNRHYKDASRPLPSGLWVHCLVAHCLIHAGFVWAITGRFVLGAVEFVLHIIFDFVKCEGITGFHTDQVLHAASKALFAIAIWQAWIA